MIRKTTLLIIFATTLFLVLLLYGISETFFLGSFANLEDHTVLQNVDRAHLALSSDIDQLNTTVRDWAAWNDSYAFIMDRNQNYISANLNTESLSNLRLNLMLLVDTSGQLVIARMVNLDTNREMPVPQNLLKDLFRKGTLICRNQSDMFKGIVLLPEGPFLISSQPVLTSEGNGPVRGTLIMGRYLDSELKSLSEQTQLPIVSQRIDDSNMSSDFAAAQSSLLRDKPVLVNPLSENSIAGYVLIKDIYGDPALILRVELPRDIYRQGQSALYYFSIYILLIGLTFMIVILVLLDKTFLSRIAQLVLDVRNISLCGDVSMRIPVAGKDELSSLSCNINEMLDKIDQSEVELRKSKERLASLHRFQDGLLDTAAIWIDMFDSKGNMTFWNLAAERISGYSREEVLGHAKIWDWLYPNAESRSKMVTSVRDILLRNERLENFETTVTCKNGDKKIIRWHSNNFVDEAGKNVGGIGIGADITEYKRAEEALKDSKRRLADIINFLPDATAVIDKDGKVIAWNKAIEDMTGVKAEDILGKGDYEYAIPFYGQRRPVIIDMALKNPEELGRNYSNIKLASGILVGESYIPNLKGNEAYLLGTAAALYDSSGNIVGAIESIRDITDSKRSEKALRKARDELEMRVKERTAKLEGRNAEMERFVYTVSHELRSPLISTSGIVGFLKNDLKIGDDNSAETDLRLIEGAVTKMDQLLTEILELSRIGRVANPPVDVPFGEIVTEALDLEAEKLKSRGVEVSVASDLPKVHVDRMRIMEVLVNLIENGIKYMSDQPRPRIEVGHRNDGDQTVFIVRDNGMGIDPSQHEKVFGLFYKVNGKSDGTGVGLALVKRIIEVHGGRIWIESGLGKGCTVCFTLPLAEPGS